MFDTVPSEHCKISKDEMNTENLLSFRSMVEIKVSAAVFVGEYSWEEQENNTEWDVKAYGLHQVMVEMVKEGSELVYYKHFIQS